MCVDPFQLISQCGRRSFRCTPEFPSKKTNKLYAALYCDETKILAYRPGKSSKPSIDVYSCAGKLIRSIPWEHGSIKGLGWSEDEKMLVVTKDGTVRCYYDLQGDFTQFSLGNGAEEYGVQSCK